jgi:methyl-accepting chemotaxis protein
MNLAWLDSYLLPLTMIVLVCALMWLAITRAKQAKREATQDAETSMPSGAQSQLSDIRPAVELVAEAEPATAPPRHYPLIRQLSFGFGTIAIVFAFATCVIVFGSISRVYEKELTSRTQIITNGLSDLVTRRLATKSVQRLANDVEKYAAMKAVAYVYVEDAKGAIIANAPKELPRYLIRDFPGSAERALSGVNVRYRGEDVFEVAQRIGGVNKGFVHFGIWRDVIAAEARIALLPMVAAIVVLLLGITGTFIVIARRLNRPLLDLVDQADRISRGDFTVALNSKGSDEIGDIARSIERLRASLYAVVRRLDQDKSTEQPGKMTVRSDR